MMKEDSNNLALYSHNNVSLTWIIKRIKENLSSILRKTWSLHCPQCNFVTDSLSKLGLAQPREQRPKSKHAHM